jgi:hypothetical protein
MINSETGKPLFSVCSPPTTTRTQTIAIFMVYIKSHPARYSDDFFWVAITALEESFPCSH